MAIRFPNWPAPDFVKEAAVDAVNADLNQYTNSQVRWGAVFARVRSSLH